MINSLVLFPANKIKIKIKETYGLEIIWEEKKGNEYIIKVVQNSFIEKLWTFKNKKESLKMFSKIQALIQQKQKGD